MRNWILGTLILGAICFYGANYASKEVKKRANKDYNVLIQENNNIVTLQDYLNRELGNK